MVDLYPNKQYMLEFTNEEIIKYLIEPAKLHEDMLIYTSTYEKQKSEKNMKDRIFGVSFDGTEEGLKILFYDHLIAIFILNEEIMFFDDKVKEYQSGSETYQNVVYEGTLRDKSHEEILNLIYDVIMIVKGAKKIQIEETVVERVGIHYPRCKYIVRISKDNKEKHDVQLENIQFIIN